MRTFLIHLNDRRRAARVISAAVAFAGPGGAHLVGLNVTSGLPPLAPVAIPYGDDVMAAVRQSEAREREAIAATFRQMTADLGWPATWRAEQAPGPDIASFVMQHGRAADLIVAAAADPDWDLAPALDFPERLVMESGRPVLIVPNSGEIGRAPRHAVVAWNGRREAARAAFDAAALLDPAARVSILVIGEGDEDAGSAQLHGAQALAKTLFGHGREASVSPAPLSGRSVGEAIIEEARTLGADIIVMGGYGHSRLREFVFGGATRHVTHHLEIPTLLSH